MFVLEAGATEDEEEDEDEEAAAEDILAVDAPGAIAAAATS